MGKLSKHFFSTNASDAILFVFDIWGMKNIQSVTEYSSIQNEAVIKKTHNRSLKIVPPDERHHQYQRILSKKSVRALQYPLITSDDNRI